MVRRGAAEARTFQRASHVFPGEVPASYVSRHSCVNGVALDFSRREKPTDSVATELLGRRSRRVSTGNCLHRQAGEVNLLVGI